MTLEEALEGKEIPNGIRKNLVLVGTKYFSYSGEVREGHLVVHTEIGEEIQQIFKKLLEKRFPVQQIIPVVVYGWDDTASMAANNTSAFNYRLIFGTDRLSNHSYGRAIDINPIQNPYTQRDGVVVPQGARYDPAVPGTVTPDIASIFKSYGWKWGGDWTTHTDWQHFEKP
jgi:hypothetical protein